MVIRLRRAFPVLLMSAAIAACQHEVITEPAPTPGISITVTNPTPVANVPVAVGAQVGIALTRTGGYTGTVTVTAEGLPTGWTASYSPAQITTGSGTVATVTIPGNPTPGTYTVTFRATGTGVAAATGQATITVNAPPPGISLTVTNPAPVPVNVLSVSAQVSIALTRVGGFTGTVTMTAEGLPTGWTASFAPAQITTGSGTVASVTLPGNPARGTYTVTFRATATGVTDATGQATITVQ